MHGKAGGEPSGARAAALRFLPPLLLVGVVLAVYAFSLSGGWVWDDTEIVVARLAATHGAAGTLAALTGPDTGPYDAATPYYRPVTLFSFFANAWLTGPSPFGFRAVSLGLHALNVMLLFWLAGAAFGDRRLGFVAALLFAVHPANVEAVAFVTARNNLLCAAGLLGALLCLLRRTPLAVAGGMALFALALLSKEPAVALPPFLLALALLAREPRLRPRPVVLVLAFVVLAGYLVLRGAILGPAAIAGAGEAAGRSPALVLSSIYESLRLLVAPWQLNALVRAGAIPFTAAKGIAAAAGLALLAWAALSRRSPEPLRSGALWLAASLVPISNLVPIPSAPVAERYLYVPGLGFALIAAAGWQALDRRRRPLAAALAVLVAAALGTRATLRTQVWLDDERLFASMVAADPGNASAHYDLGLAQARRGDLARAIEAFEAALRANPGHVGAHNNLGNAYAMTGRLERAREHFERARQLDPGEPLPLYNLARVAELQGRGADASRLYAAYAEADGTSRDPERQARVRAARSRLAGGTAGGPPRHIDRVQ